MTNPASFGPRPRLIPTLPKGDVLGSYETYFEAQAVVERLTKAEFDVTKVAIVGSDLRTVERVTGKITWGRAAGAGAASGAWLGLFFGIVFVLFAPASNLILDVGAAILIGAGFGMLFGLVTYAINRRSRDFTSTHQVIAGRYEVIVDPDHLVRAQQLLARGDAS